MLFDRRKPGPAVEDTHEDPNTVEPGEAVIDCPWCRSVSRVASVIADDSPDDAERPVDAAYQFATIDGLDHYAWIGRCGCGGIVFVVQTDDGAQVVYPEARPDPSDERIPAPIRVIYDEAQLCYSVGAFNGAAVLARRALEAACRQLAGIEDGRKSPPFSELLDQLVAQNIITRRLVTTATVVRLVGNSGAHARDEPVSEQHARDILALTGRFLEVFIEDAVTDSILAHHGRQPAAPAAPAPQPEQQPPVKPTT